MAIKFDGNKNWNIDMLHARYAKAQYGYAGGAHVARGHCKRYRGACANRA